MPLLALREGLWFPLTGKVKARIFAWMKVTGTTGRQLVQPAVCGLVGPGTEP